MFTVQDQVGVGKHPPPLNCQGSGNLSASLARLHFFTLSAVQQHLASLYCFNINHVAQRPQYGCAAVYILVQSPLAFTLIRCRRLRCRDTQIEGSGSGFKILPKCHCKVIRPTVSIRFGKEKIHFFLSILLLPINCDPYKSVISGIVAAFCQTEKHTQQHAEVTQLPSLVVFVHCRLMLQIYLYLCYLFIG